MGRLPAEIDVAGSARARRAFVRARGVASAEALLRLALVYGATALSLRGTAAWAAASGLADISDVALLIAGGVRTSIVASGRLNPAPPQRTPDHSISLRRCPSGR